MLRDLRNRITPLGVALLQYCRPSHQHTALSATLLLMTVVVLSGALGYLRQAYVAYAFGAGTHTDAFIAAYTVPDAMYYLLAGGSISITFTSVFTRRIGQNQREKAERAASVVLTIMSLVLLGAIAVTWLVVPALVRNMFPQFTPDQLAACITMTRILLPTRIFLFAAGLFSAVLMSQRLFLLPALAPLLLNGFIILGGLTLGHKLGVVGLAIGALAGTIAGPFIVNLIGARRAGLRIRPSFDVRNAEFREWLRMSLPLVLGFSLVTVDIWFMRYFASGSVGDITRLHYAKRLFNVPLALIAQTAGQAALPFFSHLIAEGRLQEFERRVNNAVCRVVCAALLASSWVIVMAFPLIDLLFRRGRFNTTDSHVTAQYLTWFCLALGFWAAQLIYSRAFFATGNSKTPMLVSSAITIASFPLFAGLFRVAGVEGLTIASGVGLAAISTALCLLLHRSGYVRVTELRWVEIGKVIVTAVFAGGVTSLVTRSIPVAGERWSELLAVLLGSLAWLGATAVGLWATASDLPRELRRRVLPPLGAEPKVAGAD